MPMPDFSFLANREGDTGIEKLASNFTQAFAMASQAKAQREELKLRRQEMQLKQQQMQEEMLRRAFMEKKLQEAGYDRTEQPGPVRPQEERSFTMYQVPEEQKYLRSADILRLAGESEGAKRYLDAAAKLREMNVPYKPGEVKEFAVGMPDRTEGKVNARYVGGDFRSTNPNIPQGWAQEGPEFQKASGVSVNVANQENRLAEKLFEKQVEPIVANARSAEAMERYADVFAQSSKEAGQTIFPETQEKLKSLASALNMDVDVSSIASANKARTQMMMAFLSRFKGTTTEKEMGVSFDSAPALWHDDRSRDALVSVIKRLAGRDKDMEKEFTKFTMQSVREGMGGAQLKDGRVWGDWWAEYEKKHPVITDEQRELFKRVEKTTKFTPQTTPNALQEAKRRLAEVEKIGGPRAEAARREFELWKQKHGISE